MSELAVLDPRAAFVDVGSEKMHVSIGGGPPRVFGTVTSQLQALRDFLIEHQVRSVAMEATGVYWLPLYSVLEAAGLDVRMVDGRQTRHLPGRKSDMQDCQWGATLHAHGLLRAGFVPPAHIRRLQDYLRLRGEHVAAAARACPAHAKGAGADEYQAARRDQLADGGERSCGGARDPWPASAIRRRCWSCATCGSARPRPSGSWKRCAATGPMSICLRSGRRFRAGTITRRKSSTATAGLRKSSPRMPGGDAPAAGAEQPAKRRTQPGVNTPQIDNLRDLLQRMCDGKDATTLPAHSEYTVLQLVGEVGTDLTRWPTEKHFASWTGLAPGSAQSGKRRAAVKRRRNRAGQIFCVMARALARSKYIALGGYYRRMAARRGGLVANKALAHKLAILFWRVMVKGMDYVEKGLAHYEAQVLETRQRLLRKLAKQFGQQLVPIQANPP